LQHYIVIRHLNLSHKTSRQIKLIYKNLYEKTLLKLKGLTIMKIQFNTDNNVTGSEELRASLTSIISGELSRFKDHITRLEVHLSDENGKKSGQTDKRCVIEARIHGMKPITVTNHADSHELAVTGAVDKLKSSIDKIKGRSRNY
jgi:ribosome-associated translation inhibitor RaiA